MELVDDLARTDPTAPHDRWWWIAAASPTLLLIAFGASTFVPASGPFGLVVLGVVGYLMWVRPPVGAAATGALTALAAVVSVVLLGPWALFLLMPLTASVTAGMLLALVVSLVAGARRRADRVS